MDSDMGPEFEPQLGHTFAIRNWETDVTMRNFRFFIKKQNEEKVGSSLWVGGER